MEQHLKIHKEPTLSTVEIVDTKVIQRVYNIRKPKKDKRLLISYGILILTSIILLFISLEYGITAFLFSTAIFEWLKTKERPVPKRGGLLSEIIVDTPPSLPATKKL